MILTRLYRPCILPVAIAALLTVAPLTAASTASQELTSDRKTETAARAYFTDLKLLTHDNRPVRFFTDILRDRVVLIHFFYTNCKTVATLQSKVLSDLQRHLGDRLGKDIFLVSITVDPSRDTVDAVRRYATVFAPRPGWTFLTGIKENVDWVNYKLGNYRENFEEHETNFLLGNLKTGHWIKEKPTAGAKILAERLKALADEKPGKQ